MKYYLSISLMIATSLVQAACPDGKTYPVTLTFDDGPHKTFTPKVLDTLDAERVQGTFFVLGQNFAGGKKEPSNQWKYNLLKRMKNSGHVIGSHTYQHLNHPVHSDEEIRENIYRTNELLKDYLSPVLRLPYGAGAFRSSRPEVQRRNDFIMNTVKESGFKHVLWHIDTNDWDPKMRPNLLPTMLRDICRQKGGIILFHDVQKHTVDNLRDWIKAIKAEGHSIVGLDHFVPEVRSPLPPEACEYQLENTELDEMEEFIKKLDQSR